ncbi:unnamed protein product [Phytomonas sp. Hart1]|nr:unnamed protein product [Phytomonas sp. Hart1]|eukprot:CCW66501.1 unnamed protein product [Phytomonas sp. isolate Hart1]
MNSYEKDSQWDITISFSWGGWLEMYSFGIAHALVQSGMLTRWEKEGKRVRFVGASTGALVAVCLAIGQHDFEAIYNYMAECASQYRSSFWSFTHAEKFLKDAIAKFGDNLQDIDHNPQLLRRLEEGSLEVVLTELPRLSPRLINSFKTYEDLLEALNASFCLAPLAGVPVKLRKTGKWVMGGGISNFTPRMCEQNVLSVSAMYFHDTTIHPRKFVPSWWVLFPPPGRKYKSLFWMGYNDMIEFLMSDGKLSSIQAQLLFKPHVNFKIYDTYFELFTSFALEFTVLIWLRPVIYICIIVNFFLLMMWHLCKNMTNHIRRLFYNIYISLHSAIYR